MALGLGLAQQPDQQLQQLQTALSERHMLQEEIARRQARIDTINEALEEYLVSTGQTSLDIGSFKVTRFEQTRRTLDKTRLIELGVLPEYIKLATKETTFAQLRISERKQEEA